MFCLKRKEKRTSTASEGDKPSVSKDVNVAVKLDDLNLDKDDRENFHNNVDILFVLDTTGSMGSYIEQSKTTIKKIIERFSEMEFNIKFSLCSYRDHPPQESTYVTHFTDLASGNSLLEVLNHTHPSGGGDGPEAVMDGLKVGLSKTSWRKSDDEVTLSKRFLFHICDAPPHGKEYGGSSSDSSWSKKGCPCGTKKEDIKKLLNQHKVEYNLIKATSEIDKMEKIFKECFGDCYAETIILEANFAKYNESAPAGCYSSSAVAVHKDLECEEIEYKDEGDDCEDMDMPERCVKADRMEVKKKMNVRRAKNVLTSESVACDVAMSTSVPKASIMTRNSAMACAPSAAKAGEHRNMWDGVVGRLEKRLK